VTFPVAMAAHGKTLYVLGDGGLNPVDTATNTAGTPIPNPGGASTPTSLVITPDGKQAYIANNDDGTVTPVDLTTGTPGTPIVTARAGFDSPTVLAVTPDGRTVYAAGIDPGDGIVPISTAANTAGAPIRPAGQEFVRMQVTPDGKTLWALAENGFLDRINVATGKPLPAIRIRGMLNTLTLTPRTVYVGQYFAWGRMVPVNAVTGIRGPDIPGARFITAAALAPGGKTVWALGYDSRTALPINTATNQPGRPVPTGEGPWVVVVVCHRT
jgi:DNA-binding beta-propeller fold protein YncE